MYKGNLQELRRIRARWMLMTQTTAHLSQLGYAQAASKLRSDATQLGMAQFGVMVPCLLCDVTYPIPVEIGDINKTEPSCCICDSCDERSSKGVTI